MLSMQHRLEQRDLLFYLVTNVMSLSLYFNIFLKMLSFGSKDYTKELKVKSVQIVWAILGSFNQLSNITDLLLCSKFHNRIHNSKGRENKINTMERRYTATTQSLSPAVVKSYIFFEMLSFSTNLKPKCLSVDTID